MIKIEQNPNFKSWLNIRVLGQVVDNAKNHASAMSIAYRIQKKMKATTSSLLPIITER